MRLIQNIYGEPPPLIMNPRLRLLRLAHLKARRARCKILRQPVALPAYWRSSKTEEQQQEILRACKNFMGAHGTDLDTALHYRKRAIEDLLNSPTVSDERKDQLCAVLNELTRRKTAASVGDATALPASASNGSVPDDIRDQAEIAASAEKAPTGQSGPSLAH